MITTSNEVFIAASAQRIFELASATERWPSILPHYRCVNILQEDGAQRTVEMFARRDFIPVYWVAQQWNDARQPHIRFRHVRGWTKGMDVEWHFESLAGGTRVRIVHALDFQFPIAREFLGKHVIGNFFVHNIATKTLGCIKQLAERE